VQGKGRRGGKGGGGEKKGKRGKKKDIIYAIKGCGSPKGFEGKKEKDEGEKREKKKRGKGGGRSTQSLKNKRVLFNSPQKREGGGGKRGRVRKGGKKREGEQ